MLREPIGFLELIALTSLDPLHRLIKKSPTVCSFITFTIAFWIFQYSLAILVTSYEKKTITVSHDILELVAIVAGLVREASYPTRLTKCLLKIDFFFFIVVVIIECIYGLRC